MRFTPLVLLIALIACDAEFSMETQALSGPADAVFVTDLPPGTPSLAVAKSAWAVLWRERYSPTDRSLYLTTLDADGVLADGILLADDPRIGAKSVATVDGNTFLTAWTTSTGTWPYPHLELRHVDVTGSLVSAPLAYESPVPSYVGGVSVLPVGDHYAVLAIEKIDGVPEVFVRWTDGATLSTPVQITTSGGGVGFWRAVSVGSTVYVAYIAWPTRTLIVAALGSSGKVIQRRLGRLPKDTTSPACIAVGSKTVAVVWEERSSAGCHLYGYALTPDFRSRSERRHLAAAPQPCILWPHAVATKSGFNVTWTSPSGDATVQRIDAGLQRLGKEQRLFKGRIDVLLDAVSYGDELYVAWRAEDGASVFAGRQPLP